MDKSVWLVYWVSIVIAPQLNVLEGVIRFFQMAYNGLGYEQ
jgi:hypothetical protein